MRSWTMVTWGTDVALIGRGWQRRYTKEAKFVQKPADCDIRKFLNACFDMHHNHHMLLHTAVAGRGQGGVQRPQR